MAKLMIAALITLLLTLLLRRQNEPIAVFIPLVFGILLLAALSGQLKQLTEMLWKIAESAGVKAEYLSLLLKVIGIAFLAEFSAGIARDAGEQTIAAKIDFAGKILIMLYAAPLLFTLYETIVRIL